MCNRCREVKEIASKKIVLPFNSECTISLEWRGRRERKKEKESLAVREEKLYLWTDYHFNLQVVR